MRCGLARQLHSKCRRGAGTIKLALGNVSEEALQEIVSTGRKNGWLIVRGRNGYAVSRRTRAG